MSTYVKCIAAGLTINNTIVPVGTVYYPATAQMLTLCSPAASGTTYFETTTNGGDEAAAIAPPAGPAYYGLTQNGITGGEGALQFADTSSGLTQTGDALLTFTPASSEVNGLNFGSAATGSAPQVNAQGSDTNVGLALVAKAAGTVAVKSSTLANGLTMVPAATTVAPQVQATGSDTNIDLQLTPKGTGSVRIGTRIVNTPVVLTDGATVAVNAALGNTFTLSTAAARTLGAPSNPVAGQRIRVYIANTDSANHIITLASAYDVGPFTIVTTTAGKTDMLDFEYSSGLTKWLLTGYNQGY
jgi:hypothetical protein